jgi:hypothetical protein
MYQAGWVNGYRPTLVIHTGGDAGRLIGKLRIHTTTRDGSAASARAVCRLMVRGFVNRIVAIAVVLIVLAGGSSILHLGCAKLVVTMRS